MSILRSSVARNSPMSVTVDSSARRAEFSLYIRVRPASSAVAISLSNIHKRAKNAGISCSGGS